MSEAVHFAADVHLQCGKPDTWRAFFSYLEGPARQARKLYLLGDIFDSWIGDDDDSELAQEAKRRLAELSGAGAEVALLFGNHDFLLGTRFCRATGIEYLGELAVVDVFGTKTVLVHGDTLITGDQAYQRARKMYLSPLLLAYARILPRRMRRAKAAKMMAAPPPEGFQIKDSAVDLGVVQSLLDEHQAEVMIHGHTHSPGCHEHGKKRRHVLPAWSGKEGGWLEVDAEGWRQRQWRP